MSRTVTKSDVDTALDKYRRAIVAVLEARDDFFREEDFPEDVIKYMRERVCLEAFAWQASRRIGRPVNGFDLCGAVELWFDAQES